MMKKFTYIACILYLILAIAVHFTKGNDIRFYSLLILSNIYLATFIIITQKNKTK